MVLFYIRLIHKPWHQHQPTSNKPEAELKEADDTNFRQTKNAEAIRKIKQVYHLERRLFV